VGLYTMLLHFCIWILSQFPFGNSLAVIQAIKRSGLTMSTQFNYFTVFIKSGSTGLLYLGHYYSVC